jgi:hypothetical protein
VAMDDIYRLVQAILIDARMTRPSKVDLKGRPVGKWIEAEVLSVTVSGHHSTGAFNGFVWFKITSDQYAQDATFHRLWLEGWTSFEWRERMTKTKRRSR